MVTKKTSYTIGICGGSASGKTTFTKELSENLSPLANIISQDDYYLGINKNSTKNMDHPDAIDFKLLQKHISSLKKYKKILK